MLHAVAASMRRASLPWFFALAYAWSWLDWIALALAGQRVDVGPVPSHFPGLFGPMVAAFVVTVVTKGRRGSADLVLRMFQWRVPARWYAAALSPLAFGVIALSVMAMTGQPLPELTDLGRMGGAPLLHPVALFLALIVLNGYAEEVGWRGFALPRLQARWSPLTASLVLAVPWALWHVPSFFVLESYREMSPALYPGFLLGLACGSVVMTWIYNGSGSSIFMLALYHGGLNLVSGTLAARGTMAAIVTTLIMANAIVLVGLELRARRLGRRGPLGPAGPAAATFTPDRRAPGGAPHSA